MQTNTPIDHYLDPLPGQRIDPHCSCGHPLAVGLDCETCEEYRCEACRMVTPWQWGGADDLFAFCDRCAVLGGKEPQPCVTR